MVLVGQASHHDTGIAIATASCGFRSLKPVFLLTLAGGRHSGDVVLSNLARLFPGVPVAGGSVAGTITSTKVEYAGFGISIMAFLDADLMPSLFFSRPSLATDFDRAYALGQEIATKISDGQSAILLYDSVLASTPPRLHHGSAIATGFEQGLGDCHLSFVAAGLLTSPNLDDSWVCADQVLKHAIVVLVFPPTLKLETIILPGSRSTGISVQITAIDGAEVIELDGRPAYTVICEALGREIEPANNVLALNVSLGEGQFGSGSGNHPGRNRLIFSEDKKLGTITLFEPDFNAGDRVQILLQDSDYMLREARRVAASQRAAAYVDDVVFCAYFDCAGRAKALTGSLEEEALVLMAGLPSSWPQFGGYTGVEIACVGGRYRALDLTGVLAVFHMR